MSNQISTAPSMPNQTSTGANQMVAVYRMPNQISAVRRMPNQIYIVGRMPNQISAVCLMPKRISAVSRMPNRMPALCSVEDDRALLKMVGKTSWQQKQLILVHLLLPLRRAAVEHWCSTQRAFKQTWVSRVLFKKNEDGNSDQYLCRRAQFRCGKLCVAFVWLLEACARERGSSHWRAQPLSDHGLRVEPGFMLPSVKLSVTDLESLKKS